MSAPYIPKRMNPADYNRLSPMMRQYLDIKGEHADCILMFRMGDFYEMFFDDAAVAASELGLTLTGKDCGIGYRAPMCGVPHHSVSRYINQLVKKSYRVAICEQISDPKASQGLVKRDVVRIVTPGTTLGDDGLDENQNNYIASIFFMNNSIGLAYADVSVGHFFINEFTGKTAMTELLDELSRLSPNEIILPQTPNINSEQLSLLRSDYYVHPYSDREYASNTAHKNLTKHFNVVSLTGFGINGNETAICAAGALMAYLGETQKNSLEHINKISMAYSGDSMALDEFTRTNLELIKPLRSDTGKNYTLLSILDKTQTAMGSRLLKQWITKPLLNESAINARLDAVDEICSLRVAEMDNMRMLLKGIFDIERLCARLAYNVLMPTQCIAIRDSLERMGKLIVSINAMTSLEIREIAKNIDPLSDLYALIRDAIIDTPSANPKDGNVIRPGYNKEIDEYRRITGDSRELLDTLEASERQKTGIKTLKIGYNRVFGYYFEVSKSNIAMVPDNYIRRQTLTNCERYYTQELKALEEKIMFAEERCISIEQDVYNGIVAAIRDKMPILQKNARFIAKLDVYLAFAQSAKQYSYVKPIINNEGRINIKNCRHPVVELTLKESFNPNDVVMNNDDERLLIITGPNMAGKSTYMRQVAITVLMAHIGCFVPASYADICLVDRIFTRVGASDSLASGQSTFMVEMTELASILNNATSKSLLILDEIGRGTATYDGLSIAWAVVEHIANVTCAKTLFATHYHELVSLEDKLRGIKNYSVSVHEVGDSIVFLHKIIPGGTDRSFGIQVAALAGMPSNVIKRARLILHDIESSAVEMNSVSANDDESKKLYSNIIRNDVFEQVLSVDPDAMTPMEALKFVYEINKRAKVGNADE